MLRSISPVFRSTPVRRLASTTGMSCEDLERQFLVKNYWPNGVRNKEGLEFVRGSGVHLYDAEGREYLDFAAGIAVNSIGHADPAWVARVSEQLGTLVHVSNLFHSRPALELARDLVQASTFDKAFFCNSGTEANEAALKFALKFAHRASAAPVPGCAAAAGTAPAGACESRGGRCACWAGGAVTRDTVLAFRGGFHGRSSGALSVTHKPAIRAPFSPLLGPKVKFLPYNDPGAVEAAAAEFGDSVFAVIVEPIQGEGGIHPATQPFMRAVREAATKMGVAMIADEVQCGVARSGRLWAHEAYDVEPDIMTLAKPLAGGLPFGAALVTDAVAATIAPGDHGSTFAGNPLCAVAAQEAFRHLSAPDTLAHVRTVGARLQAGLAQLQAAFPDDVGAARGPLDKGLMQALDLRTVTAADVTSRALERGVVFITGGPNTLRFVPPLTVQAEDVDKALSVLRDCIREAVDAKRESA